MRPPGLMLKAMAARGSSTPLTSDSPVPPSVRRSPRMVRRGSSRLTCTPTEPSPWVVMESKTASPSDPS
jgi:hypothetical protein